MLFKEMIIIYSENHTKPINTLCQQHRVIIKVGGRLHIVTTGL
jgi:hypothetical protein